MNIDLEKEVVYRGKVLNFNEYMQKVKDFSNYWIDSISSKKTSWKLTKDLWKKFSEDGKILPFFGDTVVIPLSEADKEKTAMIQSTLYNEIGDIMSERLIEKFFHVTIHDLDNELGNWKSISELEKKVEENRFKVEEIFKKLSGYLKENSDEPIIRLKSIGILGGFVAVSIGMIPKAERDFKALLNLHNLFEDVVPLKNDFYPHLTLGYYKSREFPKSEISKIKNCIVNLNRISEELSFELDIWELSYQVFKDMNNYETVFKLRDFL